MRVAPPVLLTNSQRHELQKLARSRAASHRAVVRARIVLLAADGLENNEIGGRLGTGADTVAEWRNRFLAEGIDCIDQDRPRSGRPKTILPELEKQIVEATSCPPPSATHWSIRRLAKRLGVSQSTVFEVWKRHDLKPHKVRRFKLSKDPHFEEKIVDIVGLYMAPPKRSLVICVDEKTQIQALDRTRPLLKVRPGLPEHQTHDYKRNGKTNLFAALEMASGRVLHQFHARNTNAEFIQFLGEIDRNTPPDLDLHLVVDNSGTHGTDEVDAWLAKHPRVHLHFTPTSSSWMNMVERIFGSLTSQRIRRGTFDDVASLQTAITAWVDDHNENPKPFRWVRTADEILRKVQKMRKIFQTLH